MRRILLAIDALNPDRNSLDFACFLGRLNKSKVTGVFLENLIADEKPLLKVMQGSAYIDWAIDENSDEYKAKMELIKKNIALFSEGCINREVSYQLYRTGGEPATQLIEESRFADLLVVDAETSFNKRFEGPPTEFVKDVLKKAECPVIIAPERFEAIDEIAFTYTNSASSVFAIKQFTYLFPTLKDKKIRIIHINKEGKLPVEEKNKLMGWLQNYYTDIHFEALVGEPESTLFGSFLNSRNTFIVMGAYGRNSLSQFFKHSHADLLINTITQPIFIAHV
jgi:nucleotide-binding universal stress UspA family protein